MTKWQAATHRALRNSAGADRLIVKKNGTLEARRSYFYRHGVTAESFAAAVLGTLQQAGVAAQAVEHEDHWRPWPQESYFRAVLQAPPGYYCQTCGERTGWAPYADVENGPSPDDLDPGPELCGPCTYAKKCEHGVEGWSFCPDCETERMAQVPL